MAAYTMCQISEKVGTELGSSRLYEMSQQRINTFAECTEDRQWIHVDQTRAQQESPFGGTIAHGFLLLSLIAAAHQEIGVYPTDAKQVVNYGLDKVRFTGPVPAGASVQVAVQLVSAEEKKPGRFVYRTLNTVTVAGRSEPAVVAESLTMVMA